MIMSENKFQNRYRIASSRAPWHDYNGGAYFVTICTQGREHYFGEISSGNHRGNGESRPNATISNGGGAVETFHETSLQRNNPCTPQMFLSPIGFYTDEQLRNIHQHYPYADVPLWVVMPNHLHAIILIDHNQIPHEKRNIAALPKRGIVADDRCAVETFHETSLHDTSLQNGVSKTIQKATQMQSWLSVVVRQFKQSVTRFSKQNNIPFAWQTRFHDRIIRNNDELNILAEYIHNNVVCWAQDQFYGHS